MTYKAAIVKDKATITRKKKCELWESGNYLFSFYFVKNGLQYDSASNYLFFIFW